MSTIEETIEVDAPISQVFAHWTQFELFPHFMDGVKEVRRLDDRRLHWVTEVAGTSEEWDAEITEQRRDERVAWKSTSGKANGGTVSFERIGDTTTRVHLAMEWEPDGMIEKAGSALGLDDHRVKGDLERFKTLVESETTLASS